MIKSILIVLLFAIPVCGQTLTKESFLKPQPITVSQDKWRANGPMTILFTAACVGGQSADIISSQGYEGNSFLRGSNGRMNLTKAIPFKFALCLVPLAFESHMSRPVRIAVRISQLGVGIAGFYLAGHNWKVNHR